MDMLPLDIVVIMFVIQASWSNALDITMQELVAGQCWVTQ